MSRPFSSAASTPAAWIGTSGWTYDSWQGPVYPADLAAGARLQFYADHFDTVELNASYYRWPPDTSFRSWRRRLRPGFAFTVKAPRGLTHAKRLYEPERWIARIRSSLALLGDRLGVLLVQLPPGMPRDDARLDYFLAAVPDTIPVAVEFRHDSWHTDAVFDLLERHRAAYVVMSGAGLPCILRPLPASSTSASTAPIISTCTAAATTTPRWPGGRIGSRSGGRPAAPSSATSTTTPAATPSATR